MHGCSPPFSQSRAPLPLGRRLHALSVPEFCIRSPPGRTHPRNFGHTGWHAAVRPDRLTPPCISPSLQRAANGDGRAALRLVRATPEEAAAWEADQRRKRIEAIHEAAGEPAAQHCPFACIEGS